MNQSRPIQPEDIVSISEIAAFMGVTKSRASQYADKPWFPAPLGTPNVGRIWYMPDVAAAWERHRATTTRHRPPADFATNLDPEESS